MTALLFTLLILIGLASADFACWHGCAGNNIYCQCYDPLFSCQTFSGEVPDGVCWPTPTGVKIFIGVGVGIIVLIILLIIACCCCGCCACSACCRICNRGPPQGYTAVTTQVHTERTVEQPQVYGEPQYGQPTNVQYYTTQ